MIKINNAYTRKFSIMKKKDFCNWISKEIEYSDDNDHNYKKVIEYPDFWSDVAVRIATKFYLTENEYSIFDMFDRIVSRLCENGVRLKYFDTKNHETFYNEMMYILIHQITMFNSPVLFNLGNDKKGFLSACFIVDSEDTIDSIIDNVANEAKIFKYGSGIGSNRSKIRSFREKLSGGGVPSGPLSFMELYDKTAAVVKSGGKCLPGHQKIYTIDGAKRIDELTKDKFYVCSFDPKKNRYMVKSAKAWCSGIKQCYRIKTDKGTFDLSYDHPIKLRTGEFIHTIDLEVGMRLFSFNIDEKMRIGLMDGKKGRDTLYRLISKDILNKDLKGKVVHHKDSNTHNNSLNNLQILTQKEHAKIHNDEYVKNKSHPWLKPLPKKGEKNGMHKKNNFHKDEEKVKNWKEKLSISGKNRKVKYSDKTAKTKLMNTAYRVINAGGNIDTFDLYVKNRLKYIGKFDSVPRLKRSIENYFGDYENFLKTVNENNHKIIEIIKLKEEEVYSVEVDCDSLDDKSINSGHNYIIWSLDNKSDIYGKGICVSNTRRAAKMEILNYDHPDIIEFIEAKYKEEIKARLLASTGEYSTDFSSKNSAYKHVNFQNSNFSVSVTDDFMERVVQNNTYATVARTTGDQIDILNAKEVFNKICEYSHFCGDPALFFDTRVNDWHTCKRSGKIESSNPCVTGSTLIFTTRGPKRVDELINDYDNLYVYGYSYDRKRISVGKVNKIVKTKVNTETVRVGFGSGGYIDCTPDHRFLLKNGKYKKAKDLKQGDSLTPFYCRVDKFGYRRMNLLDGEYPLQKCNRVVANDILDFDRSDRQFHVHHKDHDKLNDDPNNLEVISKSKHARDHVMGDNNPIRILKNTNKEKYDLWKENCARKGVNNGMFMDCDAKLLYNIMVEALENYSKNKRVNRSELNEWNKIVKERYRGKAPIGHTYKRRVQGLDWDDFKEKCLQYNHKVIYVRKRKREDVYDLSVPSLGNFAAGSEKGFVIIHNCGEYVFLNDSACNLASVNLIKLLDGNKFDIDKFKHIIKLFVISQDIICEISEYPNESVKENSQDFRPLGLGFSNLGSLLMTLGIPYDSDDGRLIASLITSLMTSTAYAVSSEVSEFLEPFKYFEKNKSSFRKVLKKHLVEHKRINFPQLKIDFNYNELYDEALDNWSFITSEGLTFRNAQVTVIAPTGTISFLMDCDTTGIESDLALIKYKKLISGTTEILINDSVQNALKALGYDENYTRNILEHLSENNDLSDCKFLKEEHQKVFECSLPDKAGNMLSYEAHIMMVAAVQPFISGAISKTINMSSDSTVDDVKDAFMFAWKSKLKGITIYRDGSKMTQPLNTGNNKGFIGQSNKKKALDDTRNASVHKVKIDKQTMYIIPGEFDDGSLAELFIIMNKEGSTTAGLMDSLAKIISKALQYEVPLEELCNSLIDMKYEPAGITSSSINELRFVNSPSDYLGKYLLMKYLDKNVTQVQKETGESCSKCGTLMEQTGRCKTCPNCGNSDGSCG